MSTVKSFFIVEFKSIGSGYSIVSSMVQTFSPDVIEIFSQAPAKLVFLFETSKEKEVLSYLKKKKKNILDFCSFSGDYKNILEAFYGHSKPILNDSVAVIETKTLSLCFQLVKLACENPNIKILEIDSGRALNGTVVAFLSGSKIDCEKFKTLAKRKKASCEIINKMPLEIKSLWAAQ